MVPNREAAITQQSAANLCPRCAGEDTRLYRPGAPEDRAEITAPEGAAEVVTPMLECLDREHCLLLSLDAKHRLLATTTVSVGVAGNTFMAPREIYRDALGHNAVAIVLAHNHPSGDPEPSSDDESVTRRISEAGRLVGVELLDHLIVGHDRWVSLARRGVL